MGVQKNSKNTNNDEQGFAALLIAIVLVIILSLITVGFSELMRREQSSATDKHLSSQAYYNAESGVNDAARALVAGFKERKNSCDGAVLSALGGQYINSNEKVGTDAANGYTCLLIDPAPPTLEYGNIDPNKSKVIIMTGTDPASVTTQRPLNQLAISWRKPDGATSETFAPDARTFGAASSWSHIPMLRISLTPIGGALTREKLKDETLTMFLSPSAGGTSTVAYSADPTSGNTGDRSGLIASGSCQNTVPKCTTTITGLTKVDYMMDIRSIYGPANVTIKAGTTTNRVNILNAQTLVDSTGKAQDVLRRIQVRIPSKNNYLHSDYAIQTAGDICKQMKLLPNDPYFSQKSTNDCN